MYLMYLAFRLEEENYIVHSVYFLWLHDATGSFQIKSYKM